MHILKLYVTVRYSNFKLSPEQLKLIKFFSTAEFFFKLLLIIAHGHGY